MAKLVEETIRSTAEVSRRDPQVVRKADPLSRLLRIAFHCLVGTFI